MHRTVMQKPSAAVATKLCRVTSVYYVLVVDADIILLWCIQAPGVPLLCTDQSCCSCMHRHLHCTRGAQPAASQPAGATRAVGVTNAIVMSHLCFHRPADYIACNKRLTPTAKYFALLSDVNILCCTSHDRSYCSRPLHSCNGSGAMVVGSQE